MLPVTQLIGVRLHRPRGERIPGGERHVGQGDQRGSAAGMCRAAIGCEMSAKVVSGAAALLFQDSLAARSEQNVAATRRRDPAGNALFTGPRSRAVLLKSPAKSLTHWPIMR